MPIALTYSTTHIDIGTAKKGCLHGIAVGMVWGIGNRALKCCLVSHCSIVGNDWITEVTPLVTINPHISPIVRWITFQSPPAAVTNHQL